MKKWDAVIQNKRNEEGLLALRYCITGFLSSEMANTQSMEVSEQKSLNLDD